MPSSQQVFSLPLFGPLHWTGDNRWNEAIDAFVSDHNPSQIMDFYQLFVHGSAYESAVHGNVKDQDCIVGLDIGLGSQFVLSWKRARLLKLRVVLFLWVEAAHL